MSDRSSLGQWNCRFCLPSTARMCLQLPQEFFIILNYFHYLSLFLILYASKLSNVHQIFDIKSRTSLMYDGSVGICSVYTRKFASLTCANSKTMAWQRSFQQTKAQKWWSRSKENDLRIIFGRKIDNNKNNEKWIMKKTRIRFLKFSDGKQNLQFHWP
jgi:hypothetical protein